MLAEPIIQYLQKLKDEEAKLTNESGAKIHVDEIAARLAAFYEKIRSLIDYQEEHLLRKGVIRRIFKRRLLLTLAEENIAENIIKDIIRSGHLKNDSVSESKIDDLKNIIEHFRFLRKHIQSPNQIEREKINDWLTIVATISLEETLFPPTQELLLAELMFFTLKNHLEIIGANLSDEDTTMQLYIGVQRALLRVDNDQLNYRLFQSVYPNWHQHNETECLDAAQNIPEIRRKIARQLQHKLAPKFFALSNRYNTIFYIVNDLREMAGSAEHLEALLQNTEHLEEVTRELYQKRYGKERKKLKRLAFFSVISFLLSKIAIALSLEIPIDVYLTHNFSWLSTTINLVFPPLLILIITWSIKMPSLKNYELVLQGLKNVLWEEAKPTYAIKISRRKSVFGQMFLWLFYAATILLVFYELFKILLTLHFSIANMIVFALFTSLVAATGVKIHNRARELSMEEEKASMVSFVVDVVSMPFVTIGRLAIAGLAEFNILVILVNLVIELPFQLIVEFVEGFRGFIKNRKEEMR